MDSGCTYYRARIGYDRCVKYFDIDGEPGNREILVPHTGSEIAAPPPPKCTAGRLNRPGVSYLYLATDPETAVAEVRPHPGHLVSIGQFTLKRDIWVADLRELDRTQFIDSDEMIEMFLFLHNVSKQLSMPVTPEEKNKYLLTQFFADIVRQSDFDGILYKSSVSEKGDNLVLFDPKLAEFVPSGSRLFKVEKVKYDMVPEKFDPEADYSDEGYVVYENGKWFF